MSAIQERQIVAQPNIGVVVVGYGRRIFRHYLLRRLLKSIFTVVLMLSISFFLFRLMPGSPIDVFISNLVTQYNIPYDEAKQQAASLFSLDLDAPIYIQYFSYVGNLFQGDFGTSLVSQGVPVSDADHALSALDAV